MITKHYLYLLGGCMAVVSGCSNSATKNTDVAAPTATQAPKLMAPFRYHKTIEVSPGQFYDVLAWGRGSETVGAFQILRSDSAAMKYNTTTGDLEGSIKDVLNADMDNDGNPEILIHTQAADSTNAAKVFAFEYKDEQSRQLDFPKLTRSQRKGYRGNDSFFVKDGNLMREFNVYDENDTLGKKTIQKRLIEYTLHSNNFSAKQVSTDSATITKSSVIAPIKAISDEPKGERRSRRSHVSERSSKKKSLRSTHSSKKKVSRKETNKTRRRHR